MEGIGLKKKWLLRGVIVLIIFIIYSLTIMYLRVKKYENLIYPGVYVNNISIGGLNKIEAKKKLLENSTKNIENNKVVIKVEELIYETNYKEFNINYDIESEINSAFSYGKNLNFFQKHKLIKWPKSITQQIMLKVDEVAFNNAIEKLRKKVEKKSVDAKVQKTEGGFNITPEVIGRKLNTYGIMKELILQINKNTQETIMVEGVIEEDITKIREKELKAIDTKISSFSTSFYNSSKSRVNNIKIATETINGTLLMPGDTFSFNKIVGKTTVDKGYESAKVILGNDFAEDIGGGICQVSTTLYNTVIRSELTVVERKNHSLPIAYVPLGQDAMIYYGYSDLRFMNDTDFPVYIEGIVNNSVVSFNFYSNVDLTGNLYNIESKIIKTTEPKINITHDESLTNGEMIVEKEGKASYVVEVYRTTYVGGKMLKKELVSTSKYKGRDKLVRMGN